MAIEVCGRPFVLHDPEQTKQLREREKEEKIISEIEETLTKVYDLIEDHFHYFPQNQAELQKTILEATKIMNYKTGYNYEHIPTTSEYSVRWQGKKPSQMFKSQ